MRGLIRHFSLINSKAIPKNVEEALVDPKWKKAIDEEANVLKKNETRDIVDLLKEKLLVGCKRIFSMKYKVDGFMERYKVQLVAKEYT